MVSGAIFSRGNRIVAASAILLLLLLVAFDERLEAVEAGGPEFLPLPEPAFGFGQRSGIEGYEVGAADLAAGQQPGVLQHLHMLRSAGERHLERLGQLAE